MKISDWKAKVEALLRPARRAHPPASNHRPAHAANTDRKPVEISIISTGERFVHDPSLKGAAESPDLSSEPHYDELERTAADRLQRWDGRSVRDIDTERFYDYPHLEVDTALQASVPLKARAEFSNPAPQDPAYRSSITVLAVDQLGEALVKEYVVEDSRNADGWSYSVMSTDRAAQLLREYGAAADLKLDVAKSLESGVALLQIPITGATYRGEILSIKGDTVYQLVGKDTAIRHWVGALAISNPREYVGKDVEISYPCGQIGLIRQVGALEAEMSAMQKPCAEKSASAFER